MIIGIDIGTTHIKAAAVGPAGEFLCSAERTAVCLPNLEGRQEQDPDLIFQQVLEVLHDIQSQIPKENRPEAIVFSAALHSLIAVDANGKPLTKAWLWSDLRATSIAESLRNEENGIALYRQTGVPTHPMTPLCKIIWLKENDPGVFDNAHKFLGIKDYVLFRLGGQFVCDLSSASATGLMDLEKGMWSNSAMKTAGITTRHLPEIISPYQQIPLSGLNSILGEWFQDTQLIAGAGDGCLANLGVGAIEPGKATLTIGTSGAYRVGAQHAALDPEGRSFCYRLDETTFIAGGATNNGGNILPWMARTFSGEGNIPGLMKAAATVPPGADGLLFLPYLHGERAPLWDASARGAFWGLTAGHTPAHFFRAGLEGVLYNLQWISDLVPGRERVEYLIATGGFTTSEIWLQMAADVFGCEVLVPENPVDASTFGAIMMARRSLGQSAAFARPVYRRFQPDPACQEIYSIRRQQFRSLAKIQDWS